MNDAACALRGEKAFDRSHTRGDILVRSQWHQDADVVLRYWGSMCLIRSTELVQSGSHAFCQHCLLKQRPDLSNPENPVSLQQADEGTG